VRGVIVLLVLFFPAAASAANTELDEVIKTFERTHAGSAVLIVRSGTGHIEYSYNEPSLKRRVTPGSLGKLFTALVLLENNFDTGRYTCTGKQYLNETDISGADLAKYNFQHDAQGFFLNCSLRDGHGMTDLSNALGVSCNNYFLSRVSGDADRFYQRYIETWRFPGIVKTGGKKWAKILLSIGEGPLVTMSGLEIAAAYDSVWSGTPVLTAAVSGKINPLFNVSVSNANRNMLRGALMRTVNYGTLKKIKITNRHIELLGGKTGTGTDAGRKYSTHGWNVIFFKKDAEYCLVTYVSKGSGSHEALKLSESVLNAF
jgi:cell division protein FtsI/penicillin-binding protein 2